MNFLRSGILNSVSSAAAPSASSATTRRSAALSIPQLAAQERRRAANLREGCASHPLASWDTEHVCEWLAACGLGAYCDAARRNALTGRLLMRIDRAAAWEDSEDGLGEMEEDDLVRIVEAFRRREAQVIVRIYDVTGGLGSKGKTALMLVNKMFRSSLGGAYHCGIEVYGLEWAFGDAGIYCTSPRHEVMGHHFREVCILPVDARAVVSASASASAHANTNKKYKNAATDIANSAATAETISDRCLISPREVRKLAESLKPMWPGSRYDLMHCNCCHFADAFARALGVGGIPSWINRAARIGAGADLAYLTSGVPTLPREMRGSKEDEQAKAMVESANRLLQEGLITREEYRNLREKHKRFVDEASGPCERARLQSHSTSALSEATKQARALLGEGTITEKEFLAIMEAHSEAHRTWSKSGGEAEEDGVGGGKGGVEESGGGGWFGVSYGEGEEGKQEEQDRGAGGAGRSRKPMTKAEQLLGVGMAKDDGGGGRAGGGGEEDVLEIEL